MRKIYGLVFALAACGGPLPPEGPPPQAPDMGRPASDLARPADLDRAADLRGTCPPHTESCLATCGGVPTRVCAFNCGLVDLGRDFCP